MEQPDWSYSFGDRKNYFLETPVSFGSHHELSFAFFNLDRATVPVLFGVPSVRSLLIHYLDRLLNGNRFLGSLPPELGNLGNLNRLQVDENNITGSVPLSFGNLRSIKHL